METLLTNLTAQNHNKHFLNMLLGFNPLSTTAFLTQVLIGKYYEALKCTANQDEALKNVALQTYTRLFYLTLSPIGAINDSIFLLTNRQVVLMGLCYSN